MMTKPDDLVFREANFDGLIGPSHNYSGLSTGNLASSFNRDKISNPLAGALEGLAKMKFVHDLGLVQGFLPPHERPNFRILRGMGYSGSDGSIIERIYKESPELLRAVCSSSNMWAANSATVSPSPDTRDGKLHFSPANLAANFHRFLEGKMTGKVLSKVFSDKSLFVHHSLQMEKDFFTDEGAANHTRLCSVYGLAGINIFSFGRKALADNSKISGKFPLRQTLEAQEIVMRNHGLDSDFTFFVRQNPEIIDQGVFHNDVICVSNRNVLLLHSRAWLRQKETLKKIRRIFSEKFKDSVYILEISDREISVSDAVKSYLFNSQLVDMPDGKMCLIAAIESDENKKSREIIKKILNEDNPITEVHFVNLRQSMQNGGGPACLRLRIVLNKRQLNKVQPGFILNESLFAKLQKWIMKYYRDRISSKDLADPMFLTESQRALDELTKLMKIGSIYDFQQISS
jgi:succinylarginine dihydrolase